MSKCLTSLQKEPYNFKYQTNQLTVNQWRRQKNFQGEGGNGKKTEK